VRDIPNFIDGRFVPANGRSFDKRSPVDGRLIARTASDRTLPAST
jgi:hypothetical protein